MEFDYLAVELVDSVAVITLDRPPVNAVSQQMYEDIRILFGRFDELVPAAKAVVLRGAGKHFCAGNDLEEFVTLECVSNEVGGNLISTASWKGVRLSSLLQTAGLDPKADWIVFTCADGYTAGIPLAKAMDPSTIVAVLMNNDQLTTAHGFPARIIVPGLYGMFHAKWLTKIEATQGEFLGYWQQKGWTNRGQIHTTAIIATPADNAVVGSSVTIGGVAFAGDRGISAIEVSTDGGLTWNPAAPQLPPKSNLTWVLWRYDWAAPRSGSFRIFARARDGTGTLEESSVAPPFPNGSAGYDSITLLVR